MEKRTVTEDPQVVMEHHQHHPLATEHLPPPVMAHHLLQAMVHLRLPATERLHLPVMEHQQETVRDSNESFYFETNFCNIFQLILFN